MGGYALQYSLRADSRRYKNMGNGGVLIAEIEEEVESIADIKVMDHSTGIWEEYVVEML